MKTALFIILFINMQISEAAITLPKGVMRLQEKTAPALELKDSDDQAYNLKQSSGRWLLVHFWASWCGPCRRELPSIQKLAESLDRKVWDLILVNTAESDDTVFSFLSSVAPELNTLMDRDGTATDRWQPRGLPATYFVTPKGKLVYMSFGGQDWQSPEYRKFLAELPATEK